MSLTSYLNKEKSYLVWKVALGHFTNLVEMLAGKKNHYCVKVTFSNTPMLSQIRGGSSQGQPAERAPKV